MARSTSRRTASTTMHKQTGHNKRVPGSQSRVSGNRKPETENRFVPPGAKKDARFKVLAVFASILLMFIATQLLGLYTGLFIAKDAQTNEVVAQLQVVEEPASPLSAFYLLFYVLLGALAMYLMVKFYKGELLFVLLEFAVVSFASSIVFYSFVRPFAQENLLPMAVSIFLGVVFGTLKAAIPSLRNVAAVIATAGAGAELRATARGAGGRDDTIPCQK